MRLHELAFACRIYGSLASYDSGLTQLMQTTRGKVDPYNPDHQRVLFEWLNGWGCRQFSTADHAAVAAFSLEAWASRWFKKLPRHDVVIDAISQAQVARISSAYSDLRTRQAGTRTQRNGSISNVEYGPVGAAKVLFALRPNLCPPWHNSTLSRLGFDGSAESYSEYLQLALCQLQAVGIQAGVEISELPALVGRHESTSPKLIDEFYWVTITNGFKPPTREDLAMWLAWADIEPDSGQAGAYPGWHS